MSYPDSGRVTTPGKKTRFSSAARMLVLELALVLPGAAALAGEPIPGVDVKLGKNPGGNAVAAPTGADGAYQFKGLAPGNYDLSVAGRLVQTITVGDRGSIGGVLSREPDGKASITFNGQVGVVPDLPSAPINTSRSNKKAGIAKAEEPPPDGPANAIVTSRSNIKRPSKVAENESPLPADRGITVAPGDVNADGVEARKAAPPPKDVKPGISDQGFAGNLSAGRITGVAVDPSDPGGTKTKGSHTITATYSGDANFTPAPKDKGVLRNVAGNSTWTGPILLSKAGDSTKGGIPQKELTGTLVIASEANSAMGSEPVSPGTGPHRSLKAGEPQPDGHQSVAARKHTALGRVSTTRGMVEKPGAPNGDEPSVPGIAGDPIPGIPVGLEGEPEGARVGATTTDKNGAFHFDKLPAGKYKLTFPGLPAKSITIGTDGKTGGKVLRDGNNVIVTGDFEGSPARSKASANPVPSFLGGGFPGIGIGIGIGNVMGGVLPGMGPGPMSPGAGPMGPGIGPIRR